MPSLPIPIGYFYRSKAWISAHIRGANVSVNIKRDEYEAWLERTDRLDWIDVTPDCSGEPVEVTGTYTLKEYWNLPEEHIKKDLSDWIIFNDPAYIDISKSIKKITSDPSVVKQYRRAI